MAKVWCAEITCKHNHDNVCKAKEINLSAGLVHTVHEGAMDIWKCCTYAESEESRQIREALEQFLKSKLGGGTGG